MSRRSEKPRRRKELKPQVAGEEPGTMSIWEHLDELRRRLTIAILALVVGTVIGAALVKPVLAVMIEPLETVIATAPTETTSVFFKVAIVIGVVIAMPVITYEVFQYLAPGLESREKRYVLIGTPAASLSFVAGVAFAVLVLMPAAVPFLAGFMSDMIEASWTIEKYLSFYSNMLLWVGIVFETPLVMYILTKLGVVTPQTLARARRAIVIVASIGAAVITPTGDPLNMMLMMIPFLVLYEVGILLSRLAARSRETAR